MDEFSPETQRVGEIRKRQNARKTVGSRPSVISQLAGKVAPAVLVALGTVAGGKAVVNGIEDAVSGVGADSGVSITFVPHETHAMEASVQHEESQSLFDTVFHDLNSNEETNAHAEVNKYESRILAKQGYEKEHLAIPIQYESVIENTASAYGISKDALMGLIGTENGGGTDITNGSSGARGVAQLMPETARQYGLTVKGEVDQRTDPVLSIEAAGRYLRDHKALLGGDEGLTVWAYHAGIGNVYEALRIYFADVNGEHLNNYGQAVMGDDPAPREYIEKRTNELIAQNKLDVEKLFSNEKVKAFISTLQDYSESYPYTVVAIAKIIKEYQAMNGLAGGGLEGHTADLGNGLKIKVAPVPGIAMRE